MNYYFLISIDNDNEDVDKYTTLDLTPTCSINLNCYTKQSINKSQL